MLKNWEEEEVAARTQEEVCGRRRAGRGWTPEARCRQESGGVRCVQAPDGATR